MQTISIQ